MTFRPCLLLLLAGIAYSQQPEPAQQPQQTAPSTYSLQVKSQLVALDVVVTDKHGDIVRNLTKDDFKVFEGRAEQTITNIDLPGSEKLAPGVNIRTSAELDRFAPSAPVSILVLDDANSPFDDQAFARYSLQQYLKAQGDRLEQPTMLLSVSLSKFYVLREFTTSRNDILDAVHHHFASLSSHLNSGSFAGQQFTQTLTALLSIAQATAGHAGHKNILWIGPGFPTASTDTQTEADSPLGVMIHRCTDMLREGRITLYSIDPQGVYKPGSSMLDNIGEAQLNYTLGAGAGGADPFGTTVNFRTLVEATGGTAFRGRNDVDNLIATGVRNGSQFYTLFYRPTDLTGNEQQFRSIRVLLQDKSLHAVARTGYYPRSARAANPAAPTDASPAATANGTPPEPTPASTRRGLYDAALAGNNLLLYDGLPMVTTRVSPSGDDFRLTVQNADIAWRVAEDTKRTAVLTLLVLSFDAKGKKLAQSVQEFTVQSTDPAGRTVIPATIATALPTARLRFIVSDNATGKIGADNVFFVDRKKLSNSTTGMNQ